MKDIGIIMAAGCGTRLQPLTNDIPKPLIKVNGKSIIETMIEGMNYKKITKIYIVVGYLKEQFEYLHHKYSNVVLVENKEYATKNNISSIYTVLEVLQTNDCYICEGDIFVADIEVWKKEVKQSCYYAKSVKGYSNDWMFDTNKDGNITKIYLGEGQEKYNMVGISYFKNKDAKVLANTLNEIYKIEGHENLFWDEVCNQILDKVEIKIEPIKEGQLVEVDTIDDLTKLISKYNND